MMFGKEQEAGVPAVDARSTSILAQGCKFKGEIEVGGTFRVEGEFEGKIHQPESLVVGKTGVVRGDIIVKSAMIGGRVYGNITAENKIELQGGSHVEGDIRTKRLVIDEGVFFEGNCAMGQKVAPGGDAPRAQTPNPNMQKQATGA